MSRYRPTPEPWTRFAIVVVKAVAALLSRPSWRGGQHLRTTGGALIAANHLANVDPLLLARYVLAAGRIPRFLAKAQLFDHRLIGPALNGARQIPVYRGDAQAADALRAAIDAVERGELVVVYPEGTFTKDPEGWPMLSRTGLVRIALATGAPVIPVAHWGAQQIVGPGRRLHLRTPTAVLAGPAVDLSPWAGQVAAPEMQAEEMQQEVLRQATNAVLSRIRDQLGQLRGLTPPVGVWDPRAGVRGGADYVLTDVTPTEGAA